MWECWFLWREENQCTQRKTLGAGTRTNNKLNPHNSGINSKNQTRAILVGGECCAIPASPLLWFKDKNKIHNSFFKMLKQRNKQTILQLRLAGLQV